MSQFRQSVFQEILKNYEKFYVHLMPHPELIIGSRGLLGEENKNGLVLVFGPHSYDKLSLEKDCITVNMKFSGSWESLYIPLNAVSAIFNDPVKPEFMFSFKPVVKTESGEENIMDDPADNDSGGKILEFPKRKN
ncbi:MAG: ClpXP protease specificity-enhancing factor SspB [Deferribacterales bacterium]